MFTNFKFVKQLRINVDNKNFALGKNIGHFRNIPCHQGDNIKLRHLYCHLKACRVCSGDREEIDFLDSLFIDFLDV